MLERFREALFHHLLCKQIYHLICVHKPLTNNKISDLPWIDGKSKSSVSKIIGDDVLIVSESFYTKHKKELKAFNLVIVPEKIKSSELKAYITLMKHLGEVYLEKPEYKGKKFYVIGDTILLRQSLPFIAGAMVVESTDPIPKGNRLPYDVWYLEQVFKLSQIPVVVRGHCDTRYLFKINKYTLALNKRIMRKYLIKGFYKKAKLRCLANIIN